MSAGAYAKITDHVDDSRYAVGTPRAETYIFATKPEGEECEAAVDLSDWKVLAAHICVEFNLEPDTPIRLVVVGINLAVSNHTTLLMLRRRLEQSPSIEEIHLEARSQVQPAPPLLAMVADERAPRFGGQQATARALAEGVRGFVYPGESRGFRSDVAGQWTIAATEIMLDNPQHLLEFDIMRSEACARALGAPEYLINPVRASCPACGLVCWLGQANDLSNLATHIERQHGDTHGALGRRLRRAMGNRMATDASLAEEGELAVLALLPPAAQRSDYFYRPTTTHWCALWFGYAMDGNVLHVQHVTVQLVISMLYFLCGVVSLLWASRLPELLSFAHELYYIAKPKGLHQLRGRFFAGHGRTSRQFEPDQANLVMPPEQTLRQRELPPIYDTATHLHKVRVPLTRHPVLARPRCAPSL